MVKQLLTKKTGLVISTIAMMFITMGTVGIAPFLADIAAAFPDKTPEQIQLLMSLPSLVCIFSSILSAWVSKKIGLKNTIVAGLAIFTIAGIGPVFSANWSIIVLSRCLIGFGTGFVNTLNNTAIFTYFDGEEQDTMLGWQQIGNDIGYIIMALAAGYLALISWQAGFWVHLVGLIALVLTIALFPQDKKSGAKAVEETAKVEGKVHLTMESIVWLILILVFEGTLHTFSMNVSFLVTETGVGGSVVSGYASTLMTVGGFIIGLFFGKLSGLTKKATFAIGAFIDVLALLLCYFTNNNSFTVLAGGFLIGFGMVIVFSSGTAHCMRNVNAATMSLVSALFMVCINGGQFLNTYWASFLSNTFSDGSTKGKFLCAAIVEAIVGVLGYLWARKCDKSAVAEK